MSLLFIELSFDDENLDNKSRKFLKTSNKLKFDLNSDKLIIYSFDNCHQGKNYIIASNP